MKSFITLSATIFVSSLIALTTQAEVTLERLENNTDWDLAVTYDTGPETHRTSIVKPHVTNVLNARVPLFPAKRTKRGPKVNRTETVFDITHTDESGHTVRLGVLSLIRTISPDNNLYMGIRLDDANNHMVDSKVFEQKDFHGTDNYKISLVFNHDDLSGSKIEAEPSYS